MAQVLNHDVKGLYDRLTRFYTEVGKSVSSGVSQYTAADQKRTMEYIAAAETYHKWVIDQPQLDLPESHPTPSELEELPDIPNVENESVNDIIRLFKGSIEEIINSQSARFASGFLPQDSVRFVAIMAKMRAFMTDYVAKVTPLDLPESSPEEPNSGHGKKGI